MIKLDATAITAAQFDHFATPPTHAKRKVWRANMLSDQELDGYTQGTNIFLGMDLIDAVYVYGTLDANGNFVQQPRATPAHVIVNIPSNTPPMQTSSRNYDLAMKRWTAAHNLRQAGIAPNPHQPWVSMPVPAAQADDFREADMDAIFANDTIGDARLRGTVV